MQKAWSRSSTSLVSRVAAWASVRAMTRVETPQTSAARRAALSVLTCCEVGIRTFPPRWPHFFSEASWSSQWTPAAPAAIMPFISSKALSTPPKPASASATMGASQWGASSTPSAQVIWSARSSALLIRRDDGRHRVGGVEALVGVGVPAEVGVRGDLPAGQVDGLEAGPDLLDRLVAGEGAEGVDVVLGVQEVPEALGAEPGEGVLLLDGSAQPHDVVRGVGAVDAGPPGVGVPVMAQLGSG